METTQWEYTRPTFTGPVPFEDLDDHEAVAVLDGYGRDGWELVAVGRDNYGSTTLTFKRPRRW